MIRVFEKNKDYARFTSIEVPKSFRRICLVSKKEDPVILFYKWLGDAQDCRWYEEESKFTIDVTQVFMNYYDSNFLYSRLVKFVERRFKGFSEIKKQGAVEMQWLQCGPSELLKDLVPRGQIYLGEGWLVKKR